MKETEKNNWFWPVTDDRLGELKVLLQGDEEGASEESLQRLEIFSRQLNLLDLGAEKINPRLLIDKCYHPLAVIIGKIKDPDRMWNDGAIEYLSEDGFVFRVFIQFNQEEHQFHFRRYNFQLDIYKADEVVRDQVVKMDIQWQEDGIINVGGLKFGDFCADKEIQKFSEADEDRYLAILEQMAGDLLKITADVAEFFGEFFKDKRRKISDAIQVTACEFIAASLKRNDGLCIEYTISSDDCLQEAYTKYQVRVGINGKIDGVGIHI